MFVKPLGLAALLTAWCGPLPAMAENELAPALRVNIAVTDLQGQPLTEPQPGTAFQVEVEFDSEVGSDAPRGLDLFAWARRTEDAGTSCNEAARAYLATERSLPLGTVDLSGSVLAVLTDDAALSLVNPHFQLASANILAATILPERIDRILPDPWLRRVIAMSKQEGSVWAMHAAGGSAELVVTDQKALMDVFPAPDGRLWILADGQIGPVGGPFAPATRALPSGTGRYIATWTDDDAAIVDLSVGGRTDFPQPQIIAARPIENIEGELSGLVALTPEGVVMRWLDAPSTRTLVPIPPGFSRLDIDPAGRLAVLHDPQMNDVAVVDIARGHLAQVIVSSPPVSEVGFTSRDLFLLSADQSRVATIPLSSIQKGAPVRFEESSIGRGAPDWRSEPGLLVPLVFEDAMIAVHPSSYTAFRLHGTTTTGAKPSMLSGAARGALPPMFSVTLRGGVPRQVVAIDRGFTEVAPGRFQAVMALPDDHGYELVGTTGLGGMSFCALLTPGTRPEAPPDGQVALISNDTGWRLQFQDEDGRPLPYRGHVLIVGLQGGWRSQSLITADETGLSRDVLRLPEGEPFAVVPQSHATRNFQPLTMEAVP